MVKKFLMLPKISVNKAVVLFSGGVDSTLVTYLCKLYDVDYIAVTIDAEAIPRREIEYAKKIAKELEFNHTIIKISQLEISEFVKNTIDRCYYCKKIMLSRINEEFEGYPILDGTNKDDFNEFRPGLKAIKEFNVICPLKDLSKVEVRTLAKNLGLPNWNKPSNSCLATRIKGEITLDKIKMIEKAEDFLYNLGFKIVRVRLECENARIEVGKDELERLFKMREIVTQKLKDIGFKRISLDLEGYRKVV
ncbi:MAG TPA: ATP-dependent sacrificial sulfur transferase LarE [Archaeoglobus profundus]|nr:ATP-dependent sacrificial sulfur transferase LarE [Archaeoglobus profundus]